MQGYLVLLSVIMAWQIHNMFDGVVTWFLLGLLAAYDLCAVLTPWYS